MGNDHNHHHHDSEPESAAAPVRREELDAAGKSLSDALRVSFVILKIVMIILVVAFLVSGFKTIGSDEVGLLLRFGRFVPVGEDRVIGPGATWVFPYPIDEVVKIPVERVVNIPVNAFWYYQSPSELRNEGPKQRNNVPAKLDPTRDGYLLTRGDGGQGDDGSDYNIVHTRWQLTYQINDAELFFRRVHVPTIEPGEIYFDVITESIKPLLQCVFEDAVVTATVDYTIDDVLFERIAGLTDHVRNLVQRKLSEIKCGIKVVSVQLVENTWPRQVDNAFSRLVSARNDSEKEISNAKARASEILGEAAGSVADAERLYKAINDPNISADEMDRLWSNLSGSVHSRILEAATYKSTVIEKATARADYLQSLLPEYRKNPELVIQKIYLDAIDTVLARADEKIVIEPSDLSAMKELRILLNKDPALKRTTAKKPLPETDENQP